MNYLKFIWRFISYNASTKKINWNMTFPFLGVIIGTISVSITLAIMEGMEQKIFYVLKNISLNTKISNISSADERSEIEELLNNKNIDYRRGISEKLIISGKNDFRLVNVLSFDNFKSNRINFYDDILIKKMKKSSNIFIGDELANKLDVDIGDSINLSNLTSLNPFTGLPINKYFTINGIFSTDLIDYDHSYIIMDYSTSLELFNEQQTVLYIVDDNKNKLIDTIINNFSNLNVLNWDDKHLTFIKAMKTEKYLYSIFGFMIILLSSFTMMSIMNLSIIKKTRDICILKVLGLRSYTVSLIYIGQGFITGMIGSLIGIYMSSLLIFLNENFNIINKIFPGITFFKYSLYLNANTKLYILLASLLLVITASIYPAVKSLKISLSNELR